MGISKHKRLTLLYYLVTSLAVLVSALTIYMHITKDDEDYSVFVNEDVGVSIKYPTDWDIQEYIQNTVVTFISPYDSEIDTVLENCNVVVEPIPPRTTNLDEYTELIKNQMNSVFKHYIEVKESKSIRFGGRRGHRYIYAGRSPEEGAQQYQYILNWTVYDGLGYQFTCVTIEEDFPLFERTFNSMRKSFKILK